MHYVLARITAQPEAADLVREAFAELVKHTRLEAGCKSYDVYWQQQAPHVFQTVEVWENVAAAELHMATPHVARTLAVAGPVLAKEPEILAYQKL